MTSTSTMTVQLRTTSQLVQADQLLELLPGQAWRVVAAVGHDHLAPQVLEAARAWRRDGRTLLVPSGTQVAALLLDLARDLAEDLESHGACSLADLLADAWWYHQRDGR